MAGQKGTYTRRKGQDRETNKALLLKHIEYNYMEGSRLEELMQMLPALSKGQIQRLLRDLKVDGKIEARGTTQAAKWHPVTQGSIASTIKVNSDA